MTQPNSALTLSNPLSSPLPLLPRHSIVGSGGAFAVCWSPCGVYLLTAPVAGGLLLWVRERSSWVNAVPFFLYFFEGSAAAERASGRGQEKTQGERGRSKDVVVRWETAQRVTPSLTPHLDVADPSRFSSPIRYAASPANTTRLDPSFRHMCRIRRR